MGQKFLLGYLHQNGIGRNQDGGGPDPDTLWIPDYAGALVAYQNRLRQWHGLKNFDWSCEGRRAGVLRIEREWAAFRDRAAFAVRQGDGAGKAGADKQGDGAGKAGAGDGRELPGNGVGSVGGVKAASRGAAGAASPAAPALQTPPSASPASPAPPSPASPRRLETLETAAGDASGGRGEEDSSAAIRQRSALSGAAKGRVSAAAGVGPLARTHGEAAAGAAVPAAAGRGEDVRDAAGTRVLQPALSGAAKVSPGRVSPVLSGAAKVSPGRVSATSAAQTSEGVPTSGAQSHAAIAAIAPVPTTPVPATGPRPTPPTPTPNGGAPGTGTVPPTPIPVPGAPPDPTASSSLSSRDPTASTVASTVPARDVQASNTPLAGTVLTPELQTNVTAAVVQLNRPANSTGLPPPTPSPPLAALTTSTTSTTIPAGCLQDENVYWLLRDDHRKVNEDEVFQYLDSNRPQLFGAGTGVGNFSLKAIDPGKHSWAATAEMLGKATMVLGFTGNQLMNQILLPRGSAVVVVVGVLYNGVRRLWPTGGVWPTDVVECINADVVR